MMATVTAVVVVGALLVMAWGGGGASHSGDSGAGELLTLYAIGSGLAVLGVAAWYFRRRK